MEEVTRAIYVCGATASGKSGLGVELARELGGEVVNGDAFQMIRGLEVLSAAPSEEERGGVAHHLYGVLEVEDVNDAKMFARLAGEKVEEIRGRGKVPIVVGGSGLYLKFLTHGASPLPEGDAGWRAVWDGKALEEVFEELRRVDPEEAVRVGCENRRYVSRALEICHLTGRRASELRRNWEHVSEAEEKKLRGLWLCWAREKLLGRIEERARGMFAAGLVEEVKALEGREFSVTCEKAIGLREVRALLRGEISREVCEEAIVVATRQYAKRQETWFRREKWLTVQEMPLVERVWRGW